MFEYRNPITEQGKSVKKSKEMKKKFVRYKEGAKHYSMSENKFRELADAAEAVHYFGKMVLVDTVKVDEFLLLC